MNSVLQSLARLFPYDVVKVRVQRFSDSEFPTPTSAKIYVVAENASYVVKPMPQPESERRAPIGGFWGVVVDYLPRSFFPTIDLHGSRKFVDLGDVAVAMTDLTSAAAIDYANATENIGSDEPADRKTSVTAH